jgi:predicted metal-dependent hydrolase
MTERARDASGRPRNPRPRDEAGRPLPVGAQGVERVPDDFVLPPHEAVTEAQRLLDGGRPFHAHEILEGSWKAAPGPERALWRGLAQLAVGLTHAQRGNRPGAIALLRRGAQGLIGYAGSSPYGIAIDELRAEALHLAATVDGGADIPLALHLRGNPAGRPAPGDAAEGG